MTIHRCSSFELELLKKLHDIENDTIKLALFDANASFSSSTTAYSATNELSAGGYTAGGATLSLTSTYPKLENDFASVRFDAPSWTFTELVSVKWALMYNADSSDRAILAIEFGDTIQANGGFTVTFPLSLSPIIQITSPRT